MPKDSLSAANGTWVFSKKSIDKWRTIQSRRA